MLRTILATQYVTPLREGGSLPAIVEGDDDGTWVLKFRGAGQGVRALISELLGGEIARLVGLQVPEIVLAVLDARMGKTEPDPEIQDLIRQSEGLNLALDYLPGSITFDPLVDQPVEPDLASAVVWLDAFLTNVDRTARNTNLLVWHRRLWLIDHGAALYFHHSWDGYLDRSASVFPQIKDHVLLPWASAIEAADERMTAIVTPEALEGIIASIPDEWLGDVALFSTVAEHRAAYLEFLIRRLTGPRKWVEEALRARALLV